MYCHQCGQELKDSVCFCPKCGAKQHMSTQIAHSLLKQETPSVSQSKMNVSEEAGFQQTRFVISIVTLVFTFLILFQSCAAGLSNSLEGNSELGGSAGLILSICWWIAGILNISKRKEIAVARSAAIAYTVAGAIGFLLAGSFSDLKIYSIASFIFAIICYLSSKKDTDKQYEYKRR